MNLRLIVSKYKFPLQKGIRFSVVDLDKSDRFPANFVCMLPAPRSKTDIWRSDSPFMRLFGDRSFEVAKALLADAFNEYHDSEIKAEIKQRLKMLEPKICA